MSAWEVHFSAWVGFRIPVSVVAGASRSGYEFRLSQGEISRGRTLFSVRVGVASLSGGELYLAQGDFPSQSA